MRVRTRGVASFLPGRSVILSRNATVQVPAQRADVRNVMLQRCLLAVALLTGTSAVASAVPADPPPNGCSCPNGPEQLLEQIDHVFIGDLVEVKGAGDDAGIAVIRVRENFKGALTGE